MVEENPKSAGKKAARRAAPAKAKAVPAKTTPRVTPVRSMGPRLAAAATPENGKEVGAPRISPQERHRLIAEAAYYRASRRGFGGGTEVEDWLAAEAEIDGKLLGPGR
jgi:hypothetical protein